MAKVVLVMDDPMNCEHCPLYHRVPGDTYCAKGTKPVPLSGKPDWCPLIPEPKRQLNSAQHVIGESQKTGEEPKLIIGYHLGWNDCLDALEGKHE